MKKTLISFVLLSLSFCYGLKAQNNVDQKIIEVYGSSYTEEVVNHPERREFLTNLLTKRISVEKTGKDLSKHNYTKLSEVELYNRYNPNITRDAVFNPETFNPLKYQLNFYSFKDEREYYLIDGTDYVIVIEPQNTKH